MAPSYTTYLLSALVAALACWPLLLLPALDLEPPPPAPPACPSCILEHAARSSGHHESSAGSGAAGDASDTFLRLEAIKQQILSKLGLSSKPNVSSPVPHEVLEETMRIVDDTRIVHHKRTPDLEDDFYGRTSEIISFAEPGPRLNSQSLLEFAHAQEHEGELRIKSALLWVRVELRPGSSRTNHHAKHKNITLFVFRVQPKRFINTTHLSGKDTELEMATSLTVTLNSLGWQKFDVTDAVQQWYALGASRGKLRLLVDCSGCGDLVQPSLSLEPLHPLRHHQPHQHHRPFLVLHTDPGAAKRQRRHALECSGTVRQCCKQRFFVNFTQLGWNDWIIAPRGYYANYCRGHCGGIHRTPDTFLNYYTHVMEKYRQMNRLAGMQPCCSPVRFSPISLIYIDPDYNIIKQDLPKMSVDECGCP